MRTFVGLLAVAVVAAGIGCGSSPSDSDDEDGAGGTGGAGGSGGTGGEGGTGGGAPIAEGESCLDENTQRLPCADGLVCERPYLTTGDTFVCLRTCTLDEDCPADTQERAWFCGESGVCQWEL